MVRYWVAQLLGAILIGGGGFGDLWLYWVAPLAGGALAAVAFKMQEAPGELEAAGGD